MESEKTTWERFFDAHAPVYMENSFTKNTLDEVDFVLEELSLESGSSILDVGCGTGRHSVELAKRGFAVTGLDLSSEMLTQAEKAAKVAGVKVNWVHSDAARFSLPETYDAVIGLCEGSLGLLGTADDPIAQPIAVLSNISRSLKLGARTVLTVLNGVAMARKYTNEDVSKGQFDPLLMLESYDYSPRDDLPAIPVRERAFVPTELALMCGLAGMSVLSMWGGTAGNWGRRALDLDEIEIMIVATKTADPSAGAYGLSGAPG